MSEKIKREMNWKDGFHVFKDGDNKKLDSLKIQEIEILISYYEDENDVSALKSLLTTNDQ